MHPGKLVALSHLTTYAGTERHRNRPLDLQRPQLVSAIESSTREPAVLPFFVQVVSNQVDSHDHDDGAGNFGVFNRHLIANLEDFVSQSVPPPYEGRVRCHHVPAQVMVRPSAIAGEVLATLVPVALASGHGHKAADLPRPRVLNPHPISAI